MNKIFAHTIIAIFLSIKPLLANPKIDARAVILIDFDSNKVIYEEEADSQIYPASMTKIMTTIIAFDLLKSEKLDLDDKFLVSENAWRMSQSGYSSMFIMVNDEITVENLLKGIIIVSGNDACVTLAEGIAGSEENFAEMMNEKAAEIGMNATNFANASGINNTENFSTVRDIALMSKYLIKNYPDFYKLYAEESFTWDRTGGDPITQGNRNTLLYKKKGVDGIKTGYLAVEKYSLASTMKRDTRRLISVGSGFNTKAERSSNSLKLLNWGFRNTDTFQISKANETIFNVRTWLAKEQSIKGITKEDIFITLNKKDSRKLKVVLDYNGPVKAPIKKDETIAVIKIFDNDKIIRKISVFSSEDIKKVNFFKSFLVSVNYMIWVDV